MIIQDVSLVERCKQLSAVDYRTSAQASGLSNSKVIASSVTWLQLKEVRKDYVRTS